MNGPTPDRAPMPDAALEREAIQAEGRGTLSGPDLEAARLFLQALTGETDPGVTFQTFDDRKLGRTIARVIHGTLTEQGDLLGTLNGRKAGVFVTINETDLKGREAKNVVALRAVFTDWDGEHENAPAVLLAPSFAVQSRRGPQNYWLLNPGEDRKRFKPTMRAIARRYGSDDSIATLERVMRLPGFDHHKTDEAFRVRFVPGTGKRYTIDEVLRAHGIDPTDIERAAREDDAKLHKIVTAGDKIGPDFRHKALVHYGAKLKRIGLPATPSFAALRALADTGFDLSDGREVSDREIQDVVAWTDNKEGDEPFHPGATGAAGKPVEDLWPILSDEALHGLPGDIVRTIKPHTEADPVNVLIHCLTMFGNAVGPTPHFQVGARSHGANLFAVIVAETSHGRKGEGEGQARRILASADPGWAKDQIVHGLSSGEGLIDAVHDLSKKEEEDGVAPRDRRVIAIETEFSGTLRMMRREGNALSSVIRQAWDNGNLRTMTKRSPLRATGAHVSIIGHSTAPELLRYMDGETENGFANRFLWVCARRPHLLPDGGALTDADLAPLYARVDKALGAGKITVEVKRDPAARALWHEVYPTLTAGHPGLFGAVTSRAEAQVLRLSLLYALFDGSKEIRVEHLKAALAVWDYAAASVRYIFGDLLGDPIADRLLRELRELHPEGLTRTEIVSGLFNRNVGGLVLERAFLTLQRTGLAFVVPGVAGPQGGRPPEKWFAKVGRG